MNEQVLIKIFEISPFLAFCGWMVYQMKAAIDRMGDRNEAAAKVSAASQDKSTEMLGRSIQAQAVAEANQLRTEANQARIEALLARSLDVIEDYVQEKRKTRQE